jgi:hypothetical protein
MAFVEVAANSKSDPYQISNSGLFNGTNQKLTYSLGSSSASWTMSCWVKRDVDFSTNNYIMSWGSSGTDGTGIGFGSVSSVTPRFFYYSEDSPDNILISSTGVYRDCAAWYHCVVKCDSGTVTLYINGESVGSGSGGNPLDTSTLYVGSWIGDNLFWGGYLADVYFIDGTAYSASSFGETNSNGVWIPKKASVTFGTHGFKLEFGNTGTGVGSGKFASDTSGEGNHLDTNNFSGSYQMSDSPTNNFCTYNPLDTGSGSTFSKGNLNTNTGDNKNDIGTIGFQNGKWYWEVTCAGSGIVGVQHESVNHLNGTNLNDDVGSVAYSTHHGTIFHNNNSDSSPVSDTNGCIIGCAVDMDNNKIYWHKDGTYIDTSGGTQNPTTAANPITVATGTNTSGFWFPKLASGSSSQTYESNFGNPSTTISSGNSDANGYGNFEYAVPSGYYSLCTKNLAEYG